MKIQNNKLLFRHAILTQLEAAAPTSLLIETLYQGLYLKGYRCDQTDLLKELKYFQDQRYVSESINTLDPSQLRFRLTFLGRNYLETQGLA